MGWYFEGLLLGAFMRWVGSCTKASSSLFFCLLVGLGNRNVGNEQGETLFVHLRAVYGPSLQLFGAAIQDVSSNTTLTRQQ